MKYSFLILIYFCILNTVFANPVDEQTAMNIAKNFNQMNANNRLKSGSSISLVYKCALKQVSTLKSANLGSYYYVFSSGDNDFIIVSGDDAALPILGYSTESNFDPNNIPQNVSKWLENYKKQIQYISENKVEADVAIKKEWDEILNGQPILKSAQSSIAPLIQTKWDQSPYFNDLCPYDYTYKDRTVTGCPATAMAQIMKYWNFPKTGTGFHSYQSNNYGTLSANFGTTTYDWANMPNSLNSANDAIAKLMFQCGVAVEMEYGVDASASYVIIDEFGNHSYSKEQTVEYALKTYFGYDSSLEGLKRSDFTDNQWKVKLKAELDARRPIQYAGYGEGGHTFVCDGYDNNDYFHMNWGWGGWYDGYFNLNALNPGSGGAGSGSGTYNNNQQAIVGIKPISIDQNSELKIYKNVNLSQTTISYDESIVITTDIVNRGTSTFIGDYCAAAFDNNDVFIDYIEIKSETLEAGYHTNEISFTTTGLISLLPGNYNIYMYYRPAEGEWSQLTADNSSIRDYIQINVENVNNIALYAPIVLNPSSPIIQGKPLSISLNVANNSGVKFNGSLDVSLYDLDGSYVETVEEKSDITLNARSYFTNGLTFSTTKLNVKPGTYLLALSHKKSGEDWEITGSSGSYINPIKIIIQETPLLPDVYENNNEISNSTNLIVSFSGNNAATNTVGSNIHIGSDVDYYKLLLPTSQSYSIRPRLQDLYNSDDGQAYTVDASFSYSIDGENWSETYDDLMTSQIEVSGVNAIYFRVTPYFTGQTGTYLLDISLSSSTSSETSKSVNVNAVNLSDVLTNEEKNTITDLTITGSLDARDFVTLRDYMPNLTILDISGTSIVAYTGTEGTRGTNSYIYPDNEIPQNAFNFNETLTSINLPNNLTSIGDNAFEFCHLISVVIPTSVNTIGDYAFFGCWNLTSVSLPSLVSSIGEGAFADIYGSINVAESNLIYSSQDGILFYKNKTTLMQCSTSQTGDYTIPSTVTAIGDWAFYYCVNLTTVSLPSSVTSIGVFSFSDTKISSIYIPWSVITINTRNCSFQDFSGSINVDANNLNYSSQDGVLFNKNKTLLIQCPITTIGDYLIPSSVNFINGNAFDDCSSLTSVNIPSTVTTMGGWAFSSCTGLTSFTFPSSIVSIGSYALSTCSNLTSIYAFQTVPVDLSDVSDVFGSVDKTTCILNVPKGSKSLYQSADQWKDFDNIVEVDAPNVINEQRLTSEAIIYASKQTIYVQFPVYPKNTRITIYDMTGRFIISKIADNQLTTIPVGFNGIYIARIEEGNKIQTGKVIIQ